MKEVRIMIENRKNKQQIASRVDYKEKKIPQGKSLKRRHSFNETPVFLLDPALKEWIKVIQPSRASLTYERME